VATAKQTVSKAEEIFMACDSFRVAAMIPTQGRAKRRLPKPSDVWQCAASNQVSGHFTAQPTSPAPYSHV
jgi:hypothetical protein